MNCNDASALHTWKPPPSSLGEFDSLTTTSLALMFRTWNIPCLDTALPNFSWWRQTYWNDSWRVLRGLHEHPDSSWQPVDSAFSAFPSEASNKQRMKSGTKRLLDITSSSIRQVGVAPCPTRYEPHPLPRHKQIYRLVDKRSWCGSHTRRGGSRQSPPSMTISQIFWYFVSLPG